MPRPGAVSLLKRIVRGPTHSVASFAIQAEAPNASSQQRSPDRVLVRHLFFSFFLPDTPGADVHSTARVFQLAAVAALPPILYTLALMPFYNGLSPFGKLRAYSLTVQDHFLYIAYALTLGSVVALLKWESFFPTVLDVRVLGVLPIPARRLFLAKVHAAAGFFAFFLVGANLPAALFLPGMAAAPSLPRHLAAHCIAVLAAGIFAVALPLALLSAAELLANPRLRSLLASTIQAAWLAAAITTLITAPVLAHATAHHLSIGRSLLLPPLWFTGLYESVQNASPLAAGFHSLATIASTATALSTAALVLLYPLAYRQKTRRILAAEGTRPHAPSRLTRHTHQLLRHILPTPQHRAGFHFVMHTVARVPRLRMQLVVAGSLGAGLAIAWIAIAHGSTLGVFQTPAAALFTAAAVTSATALGALSSLNAAQEPAAAWLFPALQPAVHPRFLHGLATAVRTMLLLVAAAALLVATAALHPSPLVLLREAIVLCAITALLPDALLLTFRDVPFTTARLRHPAHLIALIATAAVLMPALLLPLWRYSTTALTTPGLRGWVATLLWPAAATLLIVSARRWRDLFDYTRLSTPDGEAVQQLHLS